MRKSKNTRGFSLVSVMVTMGLVGAMSLYIAKMMTVANKSTKGVSNELELIGVLTSIRTLLSQGAACQSNFKDVVLPAERSVTELKDNRNPPVVRFNTTDKYGNRSIKINSMKLYGFESINGTQGTSTLKIIFERLGQHSRSQFLEKKLTLNVRVNNVTDKKIVECSSHGDTYGLWSPNAEGIHYADGFVGIGTTEPVRQLHIRSKRFAENNPLFYNNPQSHRSTGFLLENADTADGSNLSMALKTSSQKSTSGITFVHSKTRTDPTHTYQGMVIYAPEVPNMQIGIKRTSHTYSGQTSTPMPTNTHYSSLLLLDKNGRVRIGYGSPLHPMNPRFADASMGTWYDDPLLPTYEEATLDIKNQPGLSGKGIRIVGNEHVPGHGRARIVLRDKNLGTQRLTIAFHGRGSDSFSRGGFHLSRGPSYNMFVSRDNKIRFNTTGETKVDEPFQKDFEVYGTSQVHR